MISVVIPTCDRPVLLPHALASLEAQTQPPDEVVVVDNGTTRSYPRLDANLTLQHIRTDPYCGASRARNIGVEHATQPWIAFLDDDDRWSPDYLADLRASIAAEPDAVMHIGRLCYVSRTGSRFARLPDPADGLRTTLYRNPGVVGSNMAVRRDFFRRVGGFDCSLPASEDRAMLWEVVRQGGRIAVSAERIAYVHAHRGPRLTDLRTLLRGKWRFFSKYRTELTPGEKIKTGVAMVHCTWRALV